MKMITAIINKRDADCVCDALTQENFMFTKMATTGGFLRSGNTTLLIGTDDERVKKPLKSSVRTAPSAWKKSPPSFLPRDLTPCSTTPPPNCR